jgi:hypothetical protein
MPTGNGPSKMWQHHLIIVGALAAMALPVYLLDYFLLKPSGDIFLLNLRSLAISAYAIWLAVHIPLSTLVLYLLKTDRLYTLHAMVAVASVGLLLAGFKLHDRIEAAQYREKRDARMALRQTLQDAIVLEKWWYLPDAGKPEAIGAVFVLEHSGRLAASVKGLTGRKGGTLVFQGEMKPQKQVKAGERIEFAFPLKYHGDGAARDVSFIFYLFRDRTGSAPENILKEYAAIEARSDDGEYFRDILPRPVEPPARAE